MEDGGSRIDGAILNLLSSILHPQIPNPTLTHFDDPRIIPPSHGTSTLEGVARTDFATMRAQSRGPLAKSRNTVAAVHDPTRM